MKKFSNVKVFVVFLFLSFVIVSIPNIANSAYRDGRDGSTRSGDSITPEADKTPEQKFNDKLATLDGKPDAIVAFLTNPTNSGFSVKDALKKAVAYYESAGQLKVANWLANTSDHFKIYEGIIVARLRETSKKLDSNAFETSGSAGTSNKPTSTAADDQAKLDEMNRNALTTPGGYQEFSETYGCSSQSSVFNGGSAAQGPSNGLCVLSTRPADVQNGSDASPAGQAIAAAQGSSCVLDNTSAQRSGTGINSVLKPEEQCSGMQPIMTQEEKDAAAAQLLEDQANQATVSEKDKAKSGFYMSVYNQVRSTQKFVNFSNLKTALIEAGYKTFSDDTIREILKECAKLKNDKRFSLK